MDHQKIPILQLDASDLKGHSVPVVTEEEDRISSVVKPLIRQAAVPDDAFRPGLWAEKVVALPGPRRPARR